MIGIRMADDLWEVVSELNAKHPKNSVVNALYNFNVKRDDLDYVNLSKVGDEVLLSFLPTSRIKDVKGEETPYTSKLRQESRIGKALRKILNTESIKDDHLKECVEAIHVAFQDCAYELFLCDGEDLKKHYLEANYKPSPNSELGKSCMRYDRCQAWFGMYEENPNLKMMVCQRRGLVVARALVWENLDLVDSTKSTKYGSFDNAKLEKVMGKTSGITMLDRVYSVSPVAKAQIIEWAEENCDLIHHTPKNQLKFTATADKKVYNAVALRQQFENWKHRKYPYVDTMQFLNTKENYLCNYSGDSGKAGWKFVSTEGAIERITDMSPRLSDIIQELDLAKFPKLNELRDVIAEEL